eukprot:6469467-Amphidinium_carterae.2
MSVELQDFGASQSQRFIMSQLLPWNPGILPCGHVPLLPFSTLAPRRLISALVVRASTSVTVCDSSTEWAA